MKPFIPQSLPPTDLKWEPLIPLIGRANRSLAHYDALLYGIPNPEVMLSPLTTQEAVLSSKIEGTQATLGEVLKFEAGQAPEQESRRLDIHEIMNYRRALIRAEKSLTERPFNLNLLLELHTILLDSVRGRDRGRGRFRKSQNWIGAPGSPIERAEFVPPDPLSLMPHLGKWEQYYHAEQPDPLVQLAIVHAQFEIIHPFLDGNGRLGRILVPIFLYEKKVLSRPMFYLSSYLEMHRDAYIEHLRNLGVQDGAWNRWIKFFLIALDEQAKENAAKARAVIELYETLKLKIIALTHSQFAVPMLDVLFERPIIRGSDFEGRKGMPSKPMIMTLLHKLKDAGILKVVIEGRGRRAQVLALAELINLCEGKNVIM